MVTKKETIKKTRAPKKEKSEAAKPAKTGEYYQAIGRRKTAIARVRLLTQGDKTILINGKDLKKYFPTEELHIIVKSPLELMESADKFGVTIKTKGGGIHAQAEAVRHGISRALVLFDPESRKKLKKAGFLTRDPRMRERKKFGLKRARRAPQWQKR